MTRSCFVVGNNHDLLQWDLTSLRSSSLCVVGVNRAHMVLPSPTAFYFMDKCLDEECHDVWRDSGALVVGPGTYSDIRYVRPRIVYGYGGYGKPLDPSVVYVDGNSGASAARWALCLGFSPVWLVGISTHVSPGDKDFAGAVFLEHTARNMGGQAQKMIFHYGADIKPVTTPAELQAAIDDTDHHNQVVLRQWIREQTELR